MNKSNSKFIVNKVRNHILKDIRAKDYGTKTKIGALSKDVKSAGGVNKYVLSGSTTLLYPEDRRRFLNSLKLNNKNKKKFSNTDVNKLYENLYKRELGVMLKKGGK